VTSAEFSVSHVVTSNKGGAAISAAELNKGLVERGVDSRLLVPLVKTSEIPFLPTDILIRSGLSAKAKSKLVTLFQRNVVQSTPDLITTFGTSKVRSSELVMKNSILHVHSFYNFLSSEQLLKLAKIGQNIVINFHDQRYITGGCHHDRGCKEFVFECKQCPMVRIPFRSFVEKEKSKMNRFIEAENVLLVAPSRFIFDKIHEVIRNEEKKVFLIPNLPPKVTSQNTLQRQILRDSLGITKSMFVVGFSAANLESPYKNFAFFKELMKELKSACALRRIPLRVLVVGAGRPLELGGDSINLGSVKSSRARELLSAMDLLLITSSIDNSPNVVIESLLEGTPVLSTRVGGIPELLAHLENWPYLSGDLLEDVSTIISLYESVNSRESIRAKSLEIFDREKIISKYLELYKIFRDKGI
jgi:glycosyltransferase involved in cell wall biosynthesis